MLERYIVNGGKKLCNSVRIHGAKNAVLPIMAATVLAGDICEIYDCPPLSDVEHTIKILQTTGCTVKRDDATLTVNSGKIKRWEIPEELMREMRSSIIFLGALATALGRVRLSFPGGCELGNRPIDLHIKALRELGMIISEENGYIDADASHMHPADLHLCFPSVGATENIILSSVKLKGTTTISNAAKEPEIVDLCDFLNKMGAKIYGAGTENITIKGVAHLHGASHRVIPDRIVTSTLLCSAMTTHSELELTNVCTSHIGAVISVLRECGADIETFEDKIYIASPKVIKPVDMIKTQVYPGFPTDAQSVMMAVLCFAGGTSVIVENLFDSRYKIIPELRKMGANILQDGRVAVIKGAELTGANMVARDLRGGAALTIAALGAEGTSTLSGIHYIDRGYVKLEEMLSTLGADVKRTF